MTPQTRALLSQPAFENEFAISGLKSTRESKARELIYSHATALAELKEILNQHPGAVFIGANRHISAIKICSISTASFDSLPDKHFFASTLKLAEELLAVSKDGISEVEQSEIMAAFETEVRLRDGGQARAVLLKLINTDIGRKASRIPLGSLDDAEQKSTNAIGGMGCGFFLIGGIIGFALFGILGFIGAGLIAGVVGGMIAMPFANVDSDREAIVKLHEEFRAHGQLFKYIGFSSDEMLKNPRLGIDKIAEMELHARSVLGKYINT